MTQLQFLATLSLVDYTVREDSWLADFVTGLRWLNLWWPVPGPIAEDITSEACVFETGASDIGALVFVGNLILVVGTLLGVFLMHVAVVSGVEALWLTKKRARDHLDAARRRAAPVGELQARLRGGKLARQTAPGLASHVPVGLSPVDEGLAENSDEEEGRGNGFVQIRGERQLSPVATCREYSTSAWLHFPHIELVVLFFAFEGAVASFASAMRHSECPEVFYTALAALMLYPVLMFVTVFRTLLVRVRPNVLLVFKPFDNDDVPNSRGGFLSRFKTSWTEDYSLFSWADKGQWETVQVADREASREGDWFRIGFEPVFVDYTKRGTWFVVISLVEWAAIALVGVLIDDSVVQLLAFCCIHTVMFVILVCFKPFANSVINNIGACVMAIDAVCMALLAAAALQWEGTERAQHSSSAVIALQLFSLCALVVPVYLDAVTIAIGAIRSRLRKLFAKSGQRMNREEKEEKAFIRDFTRRRWCKTWCAMLRHNMFACAKDTREGVRKPRFSTAARSGPYPPGPEQDGPLRRPSFNAVGTVHTPVMSRKLTDPCRGGQQGDVVQTLMEAGKRAGKAEKELRIVPPAWPVERIEDILPAEMADRLLARLLHTSRDWTSRPWYNANGTPGLTHKRSCTYRIPSDRDNGSSIGNSDKSSSGSRKSSSIPGTDHDQTRPTRASDETQRRAGSGTTDLPDGVTEAERSGGKCTGLMERRSEDGTDDIVQSSSEDESFDCGFTEAGKVGGGGGGGGVGPPGSTAVMERSTPADSEAKDSAGTSWVDDDQGAAVAPEELLEVVPLVVEAVRRRQRRRVEEGLGGHEGLGWNPNFCICNVYDDHRNHLGPHSDTLSSIGPEAIVVGISLGAKRVFVVQEKLPWGVKAAAGGDLEGKKKCLDMPHNSAVVMWGGCQERYKHGVPSMTKGVEIHPMAGTKRISITLRERKETLPRFLLPIPDCRCGAPTSLNSRVLENGTVEYLFHCDRARGACGFTVFKGPRR
eukprot:g20077.t1